MYEDVGIRKEIAIHRILNEDVRHGPMSVTQAHQSINLNAAKSSTELTAKFLNVFKEIPFSANRQYTLLRLVTQLPEPVQQKAQETNLSETYLKQVEEDLKMDLVLVVDETSQTNR